MVPGSIIYSDILDTQGEEPVAADHTGCSVFKFDGDPEGVVQLCVYSSGVPSLFMHPITLFGPASIRNISKRSAL